MSITNALHARFDYNQRQFQKKTTVLNLCQLTCRVMAIALVVFTAGTIYFVSNGSSLIKKLWKKEPNNDSPQNIMNVKREALPLKQIVEKNTEKKFIPSGVKEPSLSFTAPSRIYTHEEFQVSFPNVWSSKESLRGLRGYTLLGPKDYLSCEIGTVWIESRALQDFIDSFHNESVKAYFKEKISSSYKESFDDINFTKIEVTEIQGRKCIHFEWTGITKKSFIHNTEGDQRIFFSEYFIPHNWLQSLVIKCSSSQWNFETENCFSKIARSFKIIKTES